MEDEANEITLLNELNETKVVPELDNLATGNPLVTQFLAEWLRNGRNSGLAYKTLRPNVSIESARVLASRLLSKVNKLGLLSAMGYDYSDWFKALQDGLQAVRINQLTGEVLPDYRTRLEFLKLTGKLLGILKD